MPLPLEKNMFIHGALLNARHAHGGALTVTWAKFVPPTGIFADCEPSDGEKGFDSVFETEAELFPVFGSGVADETVTVLVAVDPFTAVRQFTIVWMFIVALAPDASVFSVPTMLLAVCWQKIGDPKQLFTTSEPGTLSPTITE